LDKGKSYMFYFGILSSYIPYLLFFLASLCYLGFNYIQHTNPEDQTDKTIITTENTAQSFDESSALSLYDFTQDQKDAADDDYQKFTYIEKTRSNKNPESCMDYYLHTPYRHHWSRPPPAFV